MQGVPVNWIYRSRKSRLLRPRTFGGGLQLEVPEVPYIQRLGISAPKFYTVEGIMGPSSLMVVYVDPLGVQPQKFRSGPQKFFSSCHPKGPCRNMVCASALRVSHLRTLGLKSLVYSYTDPWRSVAAGSWFCSAFVGTRRCYCSGRFVNVQGPTAPKVS